MEPTLPNPNATAAPNPESSISDGGGLPAEQLIAEKHELPQTPPPLAATSTVADDPALQVPSASDATDIAAVSDNSQASLPAQADDADVIEKEWVDKAKKIVHATKDDPRKQEKEVGRLQADYLMKRYGKQIKIAE